MVLLVYKCLLLQRGCDLVGYVCFVGRIPVYLVVLTQNARGLVFSFVISMGRTDFIVEVADKRINEVFWIEEVVQEFLLSFM